jgi:hypothetical protein
LIETVALATPTLSVSTSGTPSTYGGSVTFTATISSGPTGTVSFYYGSTELCSKAIGGTTVTCTTTALPVGAQSITAVYSGDTDYNTVTSGAITQTVNKATPIITWATPAAIAYGTALSAAQLDASSGGVAGIFTYTPASGTVLAPGSKTLSVTFTPTSTTDYNTPVAKTVTLTVNKATPVITWATPAAISYGTALSATQLDATSSVAGTFVYSPVSGTVLAPGSQTLSATFTPTNTTDYTTASGSVNISVNNQATPTISITSSGTRSNHGAPVTFTATVTPGDTNTVTFLSNGTPIGTATPNGSGIATLTTSTLAAGNNNITASIAAGGNYSAAASAPVTQCVLTSPYWVQYRAFIPADHLRTAIPCYKGERIATPQFTLFGGVPVLVPGYGWITVLGDADNPSLPNTTQFRIKEYTNLAFSGTGPASEGVVVPVQSTSYNFSTTKSPVNGSTISVGDFNGGNTPTCVTEQATGHAVMTNEVGTASSTAAYHASVNFCCSASDPLFAPAFPITFNLNVSINESTSPPTATITGTNTCFPSHEIVIGNQVVYRFTPAFVNFGVLTACLSAGAAGVPHTANCPTAIPLDGVSVCNN